jgi:PhzF family phenazine biosynthesis protein
MKSGGLTAYHVDAFASQVFSGNPAIVCPLDRWLEDAALELIARENNQPATVFCVQAGDGYELRWFSPTVELDLCGHGTVAAAAVLFNYATPPRQSLTFRTKGGEIHVEKDGSLICMDLPVLEAEPCSTMPDELVRALRKEPRQLFKSRNYLAVYDRPEEIQSIAPYMDRLKEIDCLGVIVTAQGEDFDFVSRYFAPRIGIPEDAATGSTHCTLAPYWAKQMGKRKFHAAQLSARRGELWCELLDGNVRICAQAMVYAQSVLHL